MDFRTKVEAMMRRTGRTYRQCCQQLGGAGGRTTARNKHRRRAETQRQERMGLR